MGKRWLIFGGTAALALGIPAIADRVGQSFAEGRIAAAFQKQYALARRPSVTIPGIPFLDRAVSGDYGSIKIHAARWTQRPQDVDVDDLNVTLHGTSYPVGDLIQGSGAPQADSATAEGVIGFGTVRKRFLQWNVTGISDAGGLLRITGSIPGALWAVNIVEYVRPTLVQGVGIQLAPEQLHEDQGQLPHGSTPLTEGQIRQQIACMIPLSALPATASLTQVTVTPTGLHITATA